MFNALNRFISRLDSDAPQQRSDHGAFGFQVLRNKTLELAIEPWFDFVVGINGRLIDDSDPALFAQEIRNCGGSTVTLGLWSAKVKFPVPNEVNTQSDTVHRAKEQELSTSRFQQKTQPSVSLCSGRPSPPSRTSGISSTCQPTHRPMWQVSCHTVITSSEHQRAYCMERADWASW